MDADPTSLTKHNESALPAADDGKFPLADSKQIEASCSSPPKCAGEARPRARAASHSSSSSSSSSSSRASEDSTPTAPPPAFAPYEAEYFLSSHGDVVSHDAHLNADGEALYRFLLSHAAAPSAYAVRLHGTHQERRTRVVRYTDANGHAASRTETYYVTVVDFDFSIDLARAVVPGGPAHWSVADGEPAFRGAMVREVMGARASRQVDKAREGGKEKGKENEKQKEARAGGDVDLDVEECAYGDVVRDWRTAPVVMRKATKEEKAASAAAQAVRAERGLAPWDAPDRTTHAPHEASSRTVREWADAYAASPRLLKEFVYEKTVYGWDTAALRASLLQLLASAAPIATAIDVDFTLSATKVIVRPDTRVARLMSLRNKHFGWALLLWITLIYPTLWLFRRFARRGGGRWAVCGGAYAMKVVEPLVEGDPSAQATLAPDADAAFLVKASASDTEAASAGAITFPMPMPAPLPELSTDSTGDPAPPSYPTQAFPPVPLQQIDNTPPPLPRLVTTPTGAMVRVTGYREGEWFRAWEATIHHCAATHMIGGDMLVQPFAQSQMSKPGAGLDGY